MKTCIYARKSTIESGQKETIENQIKICQRKGTELELEIVDIKTDAATGTDDNNRPEVKSLIRDAVDGKYDCVIMKGISRLYRKTSKGLELIERLDQNGIRVITVEEHFDSHAQENRTGTGKLDMSRLTMYLMFAEMESKKFGDRIKYTQIEKAYAGEWNQANSVPYGFKYNQTTKKLNIDEEKSPTVKKIFDLYINGMGMKSIAHKLNEDKLSSPGNKRWNEQTVGFILKNEAYIGNVVYNKRSKKERPYKDPEILGKTEDDIYVGNDYNKVEEWIITEGAHDAIINKDIFDKVQDIIKLKAHRKGIKNNVSLLAGIGKCGLCGSGLTFKRGRKNDKGWVVTKNNYYCMNYIRYGKQYCTSHHIGAEELEGITINTLMTEINNRVSKEKSLTGLDGKSKAISSTEREIKRLEKSIQSIVHKTNGLLEKNLAGDITNAQFKMLNKTYSDELEASMEKLEKLKIYQIENAEQESSSKRLDEYYNKIMSINDMTKEEKRYLLLDLVKEVKLTNGKVEIELNI